MANLTVQTKSTPNDWEVSIIRREFVLDLVEEVFTSKIQEGSIDIQKPSGFLTKTFGMVVTGVQAIVTVVQKVIGQSQAPVAAVSKIRLPQAIRLTISEYLVGEEKDFKFCFLLKYWIEFQESYILKNNTLQFSIDEGEPKIGTFDEDIDPLFYISGEKRVTVFYNSKKLVFQIGAKEVGVRFDFVTLPFRKLHFHSDD